MSGRTLHRTTSASQVHPGLCIMRDPSLNKVSTLE